VPEAVALLTQYKDGAKVMSGGQSLLPLLKLRLGAVEHIVDIGRIPGLDHLREEDGFLKIGALVREAALEQSELIRSKYPILLDTAKVIADPLVRNRATIAGNLAHGDPGNDHPATMLALGASVVAVGPRGERVIAVDQLFVSLFQTSLAADEIIVEVRVPIPPARSGGAYMKLERKVGDYATAGAAAQLTLGAGGAIERCGLALTNVGTVPIHAAEVAKGLAGKKPDDKLIADAARAAAALAEPNADRRGSEEYKREMARVLTVRALKLAIQRAGGK
jgi:carbon-monoxide dehydrogenase medium subunit